MSKLKPSLIAASIAASILMLSAPVMAQDHKGHDMSQMGSVAMNKNVPVNAIVHKVDAKKMMVNVTHDPIPSLNWPKMTMDLPVTKRVDLSTVKAGMNAILTLKQGRDKQYRITSIKPAK